MTEKTYLFEIRCIVCGSLLATLVNDSDICTINREKSLNHVDTLNNYYGKDKITNTVGIVFVCNCGEKKNMVIK